MVVLRGWVEMEEKLDGDGRGLKMEMNLAGMGVISVSVQVSNTKYMYTESTINISKI